MQVQILNFVSLSRTHPVMPQTELESCSTLKFVCLMLGLSLGSARTQSIWLAPSLHQAEHRRIKRNKIFCHFFDFEQKKVGTKVDMWKLLTRPLFQFHEFISKRLFILENGLDRSLRSSALPMAEWSMVQNH